MKLTLGQCKYMLVAISMMFAIYSLLVGFGEGGNPPVGIAMAGGLSLVTISALRAQSAPAAVEGADGDGRHSI